MISHTLNCKQFHPPTGTCGPAQLGPQSRREATQKRGEGRGGVQRSNTRGGCGALTSFLEPSLSNDGDIAHGSFTSSLMPLHACSTQREREEGSRGGERERRRRRRGARGGGARLSQPPRHSPSLPSFLVL